MYELVAEIFGHQGDVRAVCPLDDARFASGARDRLGKIWRRNNGGRGVIEEKMLLEHQHWVSALCRMPQGFASGCQDKMVRIFDSNGTIVATLAGHEGPVTSLAYSDALGCLVSGSWDGSAKIWKVETGECVATLGGHENGVCVLALKDDLVVTGSAGVQKNNRVEGFQIRMWKDGTQIRSMQEHQAAVRALCISSPDGSTFASTSNDGTVRIWSSETGAQLACFTNPPGPENSAAFNFCVAPVQDYSRLATACDDCCVRVWNVDAGELEEEILHPCTVWWITEDEFGDLITGGSDGALRIFTKSAERAAPPEIRQAYMDQTLMAREAIENKQSNPGGSKIDPSKLQKIYEAKPGTSEGEIKMFNKNGEAWVYQWSGTSQTWIEVGEAMGAADEENTINGKSYDKVVPVEIEDPATGGIRKLKLGFNNGDSPYVIAQEFVAENQLDDHNVEEIAQFVMSVRAQSTRTPTIDMSGGGSAPMEGVEGQEHKYRNAPFPLPSITGFAFESTSFEKAFAAFKDANGKISNSLSEKEMQSVEKLVAVLQEVSRYHASGIDAKAVKALSKAMLSWDVSVGFPVMDLMRSLLTHPDGNQKFVDMQQDTEKIIWKSLDCVTADTSPLPVVLLGLRICTNLFRHRPGAELGASLVCDNSSAAEAITQAAEKAAGYPNKNVRGAAATLVLNVSNSVYHCEGKQLPTEIGNRLLKVANDVAKVAAENNEAVTCKRSVLAIGCLAFSEATSTKLDEIKSNLDAAAALDEETKSFVDEVKAAFS